MKKYEIIFEGNIIFRDIKTADKHYRQLCKVLHAAQIKSSGFIMRQLDMQVNGKSTILVDKRQFASLFKGV